MADPHWRIRIQSQEAALPGGRPRCGRSGHVPGDVVKIKTAMLETRTKASRLNRSRQLLMIVGLILAVVAWAYLLKLGPFALPQDELPAGLVDATSEVALPAVAVEQETIPESPEPPTSEPRLFSEHDFRFEIPGDWRLITQQDHAALLSGSLQGMDRASVEYLGGAYIAGLNNCSGCAQIVIVVLREPAMNGAFSEAQFQTIKRSQQETLGERLLSYEYVTVSGFSAAESHYIKRSGETRLWEYLIVPTEPGLVYLFSMSSLREEYADFEPVFEQVAATLRIGPEPEPTPTAAPEPTAGSLPRAIVLGDSINVRNGPGKEHDILGSADKGEELEVRGINLAGDWLLVYTPALGQGWVSAPLVSLRSPMEVLPLIAEP